MMERSVLVTWFVLAATISAIPLFLEYSKVTRKYEIIKKPRHRHVRANNDAPFSDRKLHHKMKREKAINEANLDYQDQEDIEVGITTTIKPIMVKRTKNHVGKEVPECRLQIAETLPASVFEEKDLADNHLEMHTAWKQLFDLAETKIEIVSYHWGLQRGSGLGQTVFKALSSAVSDRRVGLSIIHTANKTDDDHYDTMDLYRMAPDLVSVRSISMPTLIKGGGVLHSKLLVADRKHFYLGSANLSDRGLTKTKEMGILVTHCPALASDSAKLFDIYWELGGRKAIPKSWDETFTTRINLEHPLTVKNSINGHSLNAYFGSSPSPFCAKGRSDDLSILIHAITQANKYIYVAVADYAPMNVFGKQRKPWPVLDDLLRQAVLERKVMVKLMLSERAYTYKHRKEHLVSLLDLNKETEQRLIEIKIFHASDVPHFKSAHNKFFVTDKMGYIGTSNWAKDYYTRTAGIGFAFESVDEAAKDLRQELLDVFLRDWKSPHCKTLKK